MGVLKIPVVEKPEELRTGSRSIAGSQTSAPSAAFVVAEVSVCSTLASVSAASGTE